VNQGWIVKAQRAWKDVIPGHAREFRKGRGRLDKEEEAKQTAALAVKLKALLTKGPHTFHQIQVAIRPPAYETDLRLALKSLGAVRDGKLYSLPETT
jgi:hypothetical protein